MTQQELKNAIFIFAEFYNLKPSYQAIFDNNYGFPSISKMIIHEMFINGFDSRSCSTEQYRAYLLIFNYTKELSIKGEVIFK